MKFLIDHNISHHIAHAIAEILADPDGHSVVAKSDHFDTTSLSRTSSG